MIDYIDVGTGPALLLLPGSYSTHAAWKGIQAALKGNYRLISTSLPGYGGTAEVRPDDVADTDLMAEFVARVVERIGEPVHLVGHSWGGLIAYATALGGKTDLLSLVTFEGNPVYSQTGAPDLPWLADVHETLRRFRAACADGDPDAAGIIIDFWGQPGLFDAMPPRIQDYCRSRVATNLLDWQCAEGFTPPISAYATLDVPCTVVRGERANPAIADISVRIAAAVPNSAAHVVKGAGHFLITTHPGPCASIIDGHIRSLGANTQRDK